MASLITVSAVDMADDSDTLNLSAAMKTVQKNSKLCRKHLGRGVVYIKNIPHGFYEEEMKHFFRQFGTITHIVLARSKTSGKSKGFAYIEFLYRDIAKIVADTMNNYLMAEKLLKTKFIPSEQFNVGLFYRKHPTEKNYPHKKNRKKNTDNHNSDVPLMGVMMKQKKLEESHSRLMENLENEGIKFEFQVNSIHCGPTSPNDSMWEDEESEEEEEVYASHAVIDNPGLEKEEVFQRGLDDFFDLLAKDFREKISLGSKDWPREIRIISCKEEHKEYFERMKEKYDWEEDKMPGQRRRPRRGHKCWTRKKRRGDNFLFEDFPKRKKRKRHPFARYQKYHPTLSKGLLFRRKYPDFHVKGSLGYEKLISECFQKKLRILLGRQECFAPDRLIRKKRRRKKPIVLLERFDVTLPENCARVEKPPEFASSFLCTKESHSDVAEAINVPLKKNKTEKNVNGVGNSETSKKQSINAQVENVKVPLVSLPEKTSISSVSKTAAQDKSIPVRRLSVVLQREDVLKYGAESAPSPGDVKNTKALDKILVETKEPGVTVIEAVHAGNEGISVTAKDRGSNTGDSGASFVPNAGTSGTTKTGTSKAGTAVTVKAGTSVTAKAGPPGIAKAGPSGIAKAGPSVTAKAGPPGIAKAGPPGIAKAGPSVIDKAGPSVIHKAGPSGIDKAGPSGIDKAGPSGIDKAGPSGIDKAGPSVIDKAGLSGIDKAGPSGINKAGPSGSAKTTLPGTAKTAPSGTAKTTPSITSKASLSGTAKASGTSKAGPSGIAKGGTSGTSEYYTSESNDPFINFLNSPSEFNNYELPKFPEFEGPVQPMVMIPEDIMSFIFGLGNETADKNPKDLSSASPSGSDKAKQPSSAGSKGSPRSGRKGGKASATPVKL